MYNGSKAVHKSNFDAYVLNDLGKTKFRNLTKWNEKSGTSHLYACLAIFYGTAEAFYNKEYTLKVSIYCHRDGTFTKKYVPAL